MPNRKLKFSILLFSGLLILGSLSIFAQDKKAAFKSNKSIAYPTYEQKKAEDEEDTPYLVFTVLDEDGNVVRNLRARARVGLQRIVWDLKYPDFRATSTRDAGPTSSGPSGTWVLPGNYQVFLSKNVNGTEIKLTEPVSFIVKSLGNTSLPAKDRAELTAFLKQVRKLSAAVGAASGSIRDLSDKVVHFKVALKSVSLPDNKLLGEIKAFEKKVAEVQRKLSGDRTFRSIDQETEPGLFSRIRGVIGDHRRSTSAPTQSQKDAFRIVSDEFPPILEEVKKLVEEVKKIEKKLDEIGAPYTPGILPVLKKNNLNSFGGDENEIF